MHKLALGVYPVTPTLLEWAAHTYNAVDWATFIHWHSMESLREIADDHSMGRLDDISARQLLRQANQLKGTDYSLEEIMHLESRHIFSPNNDSIIFHSGEHSDLFEFFSSARFTDHPLDALITGGGIIDTVLMVTHDGLDGLILQHFQGPLLIAMRSMRSEMCSGVGVIEDFYEVSDAMMSGSTETYSLPREAIGIINQERRSMSW